MYCKNIIDRYAARPHSLEDMSLAEFTANYTYKRDNTNDATQCEGDISGGSDMKLQPDDDFFATKNNHPPKWPWMHEEERKRKL